MVACSPNMEPYAELYTLFNAHRFHDALSTATLLDRQGVKLSRDVIYHLLQFCSKKKDLAAARQIHALMRNSHLHLTVCLANCFIRLYSSCGSLSEADNVFRTIKNPTGLSWNAIISAYANLGYGLRALVLYMQMQQAGKKPDKVTLLSVLKACAGANALVPGRLIHEHILINEAHLDLALGNTLVDMYAKCGSLEEAHNVFKLVPNRNVVSWDAMIGGYVLHGQGCVALQLFHEMQQEGIRPDRVTFLGVLKACCSADTLSEGVLAHEQIVNLGLDSDVTIASTLVDMYAKCGSLEEARMVFDTMMHPNLVSWGAMISGYAQHGQGLAALYLFEDMEVKGCKADKYNYSGVLRACGLVNDLVKGRLIHERVTRAGLESGEVIGDTLVDMYAKCGSLYEAQKVCDILCLRNPISWGALIMGHVQFGGGRSALTVFHRMQHLGIQASKVTYLCVVKACSNVQDEQEGELVHNGIAENGFEQDVLIGSALVDMYAKCGNVDEARHVFDRLQAKNVVTWGAMLTGYSQQGLALPCLELYEKLQGENVEPNMVIYLCALKACSSIGTWSLGGMLHSQIIKGLLETDPALGNALVDVYAKCGSLQEAQCVLERLENRDVVSYNAIIMGHAESGNCKHALECLESMCLQGLKPDVVIFTTILTACSHAGLVNEGYSLFNQMREDYGIELDLGHLTCIVDLLGHGGWLKEAEAVIETMHIPPDLAIWRSLLTSCRMYKEMELANKCFDHAIRLAPNNASVYTVMTQIYIDANRWDKVRDIQAQRMRAGVRRKPGKAWIDIKNNVYEFVVGDEGVVIDEETPINKARLLSRSMRGDGYLPLLDLVLDSTLSEESFNVLWNHEQVHGQFIETKTNVYKLCNNTFLNKSANHNFFDIHGTNSQALESMGS